MRWISGSLTFASVCPCTSDRTFRWFPFFFFFLPFIVYHCSDLPVRLIYRRRPTDVIRPNHNGHECRGNEPILFRNTPFRRHCRGRFGNIMFVRVCEPDGGEQLTFARVLYCWPRDAVFWSQAYTRCRISVSRRPGRTKKIAPFRKNDRNLNVWSEKRARSRAVDSACPDKIVENQRLRIPIRTEHRDRLALG